MYKRQVGNKLRYSLNNAGSFMQSVTEGLKQIFRGQVQKDDVLSLIHIYIPVLVFAIKDPENILKVLKGEHIGSVIGEE